MSLVYGLLNRARAVGNRFAPLFKNRWLRLSLQILVLLFCGFYLVRSLQGIGNFNVLLNGNLWLAILALAGTIGSTFLGALNWWIVLQALNQQVTWRTAARIHFQSTLAKYLPGYFWQLLGKAYMTRRAGSSLRNASLGLMVEMGIICATGSAIVLLLLPDGLAQAAGLQAGLPFLATAALLLLAAIPFVTRWLVQRLGAPGMKTDLRWLAGSELLVVINWVLNGSFFWLLGNAITPVSLAQLPAFVFVLTASFLIGFLVLIVPGSIGVREAVIIFLLGPVLGNPLAAVAALLDRVAFILGEVLSYLIFWVYERVARP